MEEVTFHKMRLRIFNIYLRIYYNAKLHPKVKGGQMTEKDVFEEFLVHFGDVDHDGKLYY